MLCCQRSQTISVIQCFNLTIIFKSAACLGRRWCNFRLDADRLIRGAAWLFFSLRPTSTRLFTRNPQLITASNSGCISSARVSPKVVCGPFTFWLANGTVALAAQLQVWRRFLGHRARPSRRPFRPVLRHRPSRSVKGRLVLFWVPVVLGNERGAVRRCCCLRAAAAGSSVRPDGSSRGRIYLSLSELPTYSGLKLSNFEKCLWIFDLHRFRNETFSLLRPAGFFIDQWNSDFICYWRRGHAQNIPWFGFIAFNSCLVFKMIIWTL